jgi:hypothetical protein
MEDVMKAFRVMDFKLLVFILGVMLLAVAVNGCGGGATSAGSSDESGDLVVSLTDAEGDFASYTVDLASLTLTKANGAVVSTLPLTSRLDFAQYTDMTEFLTAATVPSGVYVEARMVLDYSNAAIWVEDAAGDLVQVDTILDENGDPVEQVEVAVQLEDRNRLAITPGVAAHLQLDFDLKATNTVTFDGAGAATVAVDPYLIADVNRADTKIHRIRGLLSTVDPTDNAFTVVVRPFYAALTGSHSRFGRLDVTTDGETLFDINGADFQGADGLDAMQGLDPLTAVVAVGDLKFNPLRYEADQVYAGSSVPWGDQDIVSGSVVAREGDVLTVKGATLVRSDGSVIFHDLVSVTVGDATRVSRQLSVERYTIDAISIGQRVTVFGTLSDDTLPGLALDATGGHVRMKLTTVRGSVVSLQPSDDTAQLGLDLQSINLHRAGIFDFSGTGVTDENDADPTSYEINTGTIDLESITAGDPVKVRGFVHPFGAAPQDFDALTIINAVDLYAFLKVRWAPSSAAAIDSVSADGLTLNLDGVGLPHHVFRGWVLTDLTETAQPPVVAPREAGRGLFILRLDGVVQVFLAFGDYAGELEQYLASGWQVRTIWARGDYDDSLATLSADLVDIHLK